MAEFLAQAQVVAWAAGESAGSAHAGMARGPFCRSGPECTVIIENCFIFSEANFDDFIQRMI